MMNDRSINLFCYHIVMITLIALNAASAGLELLLWHHFGLGSKIESSLRLQIKSIGVNVNRDRKPQR